MIDLDDEACEAAQRELGTTTKKDTVNAALKFVAQRSERTRARFSELWGEDIGNPDVMRQAR